MGYLDYQEKIMTAVRNRYLNFEMMDPTLVVRKENFSCQDSIIIYLKISPDKTILDLSYQGNGCILSQGCTSLVLEYFKGKKIDEIKLLSQSDFFTIVPLNNNCLRKECIFLGWDLFFEAIREYLRDLS